MEIPRILSGTSQNDSSEPLKRKQIQLQVVFAVFVLSDSRRSLRGKKKIRSGDFRHFTNRTYLKQKGSHVYVCTLLKWII